MLSSVAFCRQRVVKPKVKLCVTQQPWVLDGFRKLHYDLELFSFDGECETKSKTVCYTATLGSRWFPQAAL